MADGSSEEALKEIIQFLHASSPFHIKSAALEYIAGLTSTNSGCSLISSSKDLLPALAKLAIEESNEEIIHTCLKTFVNVLSDPEKAHSYGILDSKFLSFLIKYVLRRDSKYADDAAKLLSNLTRTENNCSEVIVAINNLQDVALSDFVDAFCIRDYNKHAMLSHLGSFLSNMTSLKDARKMFLDRDRCIVQRLLPYTVHMECITRRASAVRILRNISFETDSHDWLLSKDVDIVPHLLLPLAGSEELPDEEMDQLPLDLQYLPSDKQREPDEDIKEMLVETLLQLCARRIGRDFLKNCGTYIVIRELHNNEKNEKLCLTLEKLIQILIGEEPENNMENLKEVQLPPHIQDKLDELDKEL